MTAGEEQFAEILAWVALTLVLVLVAAALEQYLMKLSASGKVNKTRISLLCGAALTIFIWGPWFAYGLRNINRWNVGVINDLEREEIVAPPSDVTRPSKSDPSK